MFLGHLVPGLSGERIQNVKKGREGGLLGQPSLRELHPLQEVLEARVESHFKSNQNNLFPFSLSYMF